MSAVDDLFDFHAENSWNDDQRQGRFYGVVDGVVTEVESSSPALGRIKADIGHRTKDDSGATVGQVTDWLDPVWPGGMECLPNKGDPVWVWFVDGDPNRGIWAWHPTSTTTGRPVEPATLGKTLIGVLNHYASLINDVKSKYNSHTHQVSGVTAGMASVTSATPSATVAVADAPKSKDADGSVVADKSSSEIVLSGVIKLR
jgi:hypothetical protein